YLAPEAGELLQLLGEPRVLKVTPAEDGGAYLQFETTHEPGSSVPPHWHHDEDEAFYVLAGEYTFSIGDSRVTAPAGAFAFVPRGPCMRLRIAVKCEGGCWSPSRQGLDTRACSVLSMR